MIYVQFWNLVEENWTSVSSGVTIDVPTPSIFGKTVLKNY